MPPMKPLSLAAVAMLTMLLCVATAALSQPVLTSLNADELTRSGRLVLLGTGFGAPSPTSAVEVDGLSAWFTTWTDGRIVAWVPEGAALGAVDVRVETAAGSSNTLPLTVRMRMAEDRVRWRFEADTDNLWFRPALAPNGTVYLHSSEGFVYALAPSGALKWTGKVIAFPYAPPTAGPDGRLYVGSINRVYAFTPGGKIAWQLQDQGAQAVQIVPTIGPDGNLYGAHDPGSTGFGAYSLEVSSAVRWTHPGTPVMHEEGGLGANMVFGPSRAGGPVDQLYIGMDREGDNHLYAFSLDGDQRWAIPVGPNGFGAEPAIGADGTVYSTDFIAAGFGWVIRGFDPADGSERLFYDGNFVSGVSHLDVGPDDTLYYVSDLGHLEAFDPHSETLRWERFDGEVLGRPAVSPDGATIIVDGVPSFGLPGFVKAFDAADGALLWTVRLPGDIFPGTRFLGTDWARFTPDGVTAYMSTVAISGGTSDPHTLLFTLSVGEPCAADVNGDGKLSALDVAAFKEATLAGDPAADFDGDDDIDTADRLAFRAAYNAGCD
jgi:outer membrane protein assembly factor BamB